MRDLSQAILTTVRTWVSPVTVEEYRPENFSVPFVWLRHPQTNIGPYRAYDVLKGAILYIDIFGSAWSDVDAIEKDLAPLENYVVLTYGDAKVIRYQKESAIPVYEEGSAHLVLTYSAAFADMRVYG